MRWSTVRSFLGRQSETCSDGILTPGRSASESERPPSGGLLRFLDGLCTTLHTHSQLSSFIHVRHE